jgi:hypothetical protein
LTALLRRSILPGSTQSGSCAATVFFGRTQGPLSLHRQANRRQMLKTRNASESPHKGGNGAFIQSHRSRAKVFVGVAIF